jgi:rod shape-determining protein MreD
MTAPRAGFRDSPSDARPALGNWAFLAGVPLAAILFQVYVPRFVTDLAYLEVPLLVVVYFALSRRSPVTGLLYGAAVGLAQDSLSHHPLGMYGIVKTLAGYFTAFVSQRFEVRHAGVRASLAFFFYFFHEFFYWVLARALLGQPLDFDPIRTLVLGLLNAAVAVPLFRILDRLSYWCES